MRWRKLGLLFSAAGNAPWLVSHAANPTAEVLEGGRVRVWFSSRDNLRRSHIGAAVFDLQPAPRLLDLTTSPVLAPGPAGAFDDSGTSMGCIVRRGAERWLYYLGWNLGVTVPWRNSIGLAISRDDGRTFARHSPAPVMDRNREDPFSLSYPWILAGDGSAGAPGWRMWYGSNRGWGSSERDMDHVLKHATSGDGLHWRREEKPVLPHAGEGEFAHARPCVIRDRDRYRMWFAHRGERYALGYAESADGREWLRDDSKAALAPGAAGEWDSEMIAYPCVFDAAAGRYLLYNGNAYGRTGFGLAVLE